MAFSALKRKFTEQFLGWNERGNDGGQPSEDAAGEEVQAYVVGDRLVPCPPGQRPAPGAFEHAVCLMDWIVEKYPTPARQLRVASHDLEHRLYPQLLAETKDTRKN